MANLLHSFPIVDTPIDDTLFLVTPARGAVDSSKRVFKKMVFSTRKKEKDVPVENRLHDRNELEWVLFEKLFVRIRESKNDLVIVQIDQIEIGREDGALGELLSTHANIPYQAFMVSHRSRYISSPI